MTYIQTDGQTTLQQHVTIGRIAVSKCHLETKRVIPQIHIRKRVNFDVAA